MISIALTGGIATGKSTFSDFLADFLDGRVEIFDCDAAVHDLLTTTAIVDHIAKSFGSEIITPEGQVPRSVLRELVFADETKRKKLESILHPEVLAAASAARDRAIEKKPSMDLFVCEVPLLYEAEFPIGRDIDIVVAASRPRQKQRLKEIRQLDDRLTEAILAAQMPIEEKMERADRVFWNDGPMTEMEEQTRLFLGGVLGLL